MSAVRIKDSYKVSKKDFNTYLFELAGNEAINRRSWFSLKMEWAVHNALYSLGLWKDRTRHVDLEYPQNRWLTLCYIVAGLIVWPFIR